MILADVFETLFDAVGPGGFALFAAALVLFVVLYRKKYPARFSPEQLRAAREAQARLAAIARPPNARPLAELESGPMWARGFYAGKLASGRDALVFAGADVAIGTRLERSLVSVELLAPAAPRVSIRRRGLLDLLGLYRNRVIAFDEFVGFSLDHEVAKRAFDRSPELAREVRAAFEEFGLGHLIIWGGKLQARTRRRLSGAEVQELLAALERIVAAFEPVPVTVRILGGERRALRGFGGRPRCACCHDEITGEEPDLVACPSCQTVLHESCWQDLGRCPILGCGAREPERPRDGRSSARES